MQNMEGIGIDVVESSRVRRKSACSGLQSDGYDILVGRPECYDASRSSDRR